MDDQVKLLLDVLAETRKERDALAATVKTATADSEMYRRWWNEDEQKIAALTIKLAEALAARDPFLPAPEVPK